MAAHGRISLPFIGWIIVHCIFIYVYYVHSSIDGLWLGFRSGFCHWERGVASCGNHKCGGIWLFWGKDFGVWFQVVLLVKSLALSAGDGRDVGLIPGLRRSLGGGRGNSLQCAGLGNSMDREAWWATVLKVAKGQTWLRWLSPRA